MRHGNKTKYLGRDASHRKAMLSNMASSLILNKRITTTVARAKALRIYVEPIITKSKNDTTHSRRTVFSQLQNKESVNILFRDVSEKVADRPGGYTRIIKLGNRKGDNADMCLIELVDYNEIYTTNKKGTDNKTKTRRRKSSSKKSVNISDNQTTQDLDLSNDVRKDNLTKIEGIGPKVKELFYEKQIYTFLDLSKKSEEELKQILAEKGGRYKAMDCSTWSKQADLAANDKWDELKKWQDELNGGVE